MVQVPSPAPTSNNRLNGRLLLDWRLTLSRRHKSSRACSVSTTCIRYILSREFASVLDINIHAARLSKHLSSRDTI